MAGRTTVAALKAIFPDVARRVLEHALAAIRRMLRIARRQQLAQLTWSRPGTVWAADFTQLDGRGSPHALSVRDLASSAALHASIVDSPNADAVVAVLIDLFGRHGPPLVLKMDNGSCFTADRTARLLDARGVLALYSPPRTPRYNGACEAGIGSVKRTAVDVACVAANDALPAQDHLTHAVSILNAMPRGRAASSWSPDVLWAQRDAISPALRCQLRARWRRHESRARDAAGIAKHASLRHAQQASLDRHAIREALCDLDLLSIRRR